MDPLPAAVNRVCVRVRPGMEGMLSLQPCLCSSLQLPILARTKALTANVWLCMFQLLCLEMRSALCVRSLPLSYMCLSLPAWQSTTPPTGWTVYDKSVGFEHAVQQTSHPPHLQISPHTASNTVCVYKSSHHSTVVAVQVLVHTAMCKEQGCSVIPHPSQ